MKSGRNPAKSRLISTKFGKLVFLFFIFIFFISDLCEPKLIREELLGREHGVGEEGSPDFTGFQPNFAGITVDGILRKKKK
jgi:hypothetical protein